VTGIEPAWPAWQAWEPKHQIVWSGPRQGDAVPSTCLSGVAFTKVATAPEFRTHSGEQRAWPSRVASAQPRRAGSVRASKKQGARPSDAVLRDCPGVGCSPSSLPRSPVLLPLTPVIITEPARPGRSDLKWAGGRHRRRLGRIASAAGRARRLAGRRRDSHLVFRWAPRR
jgi:hypothetical protein